MKVDILTHPEFEREFKRLSKKYHSLVDDYAQLLEDLEKSPLQGTSLGMGTRKSVWVLTLKVEARVEVCVLSHTQSYNNLQTSWN